MADTQRTKARAFMRAEGYDTGGAVSVKSAMDDTDRYSSDVDEGAVYDSPMIGPDDALIVGAPRYGTADERVKTEVVDGDADDDDTPTPNDGVGRDIDAIPGNSRDQKWKTAGDIGGYRRRK